MITCKNLTLGYDNEVVTENVNFRVNEGDYLCIVGENGAGKSTLMKTLLGLTPLLGGEILYEDGMKKNEIGYLPQQTVVQKDFPASVWEVVLSGNLSRLGHRPFYGREEKERAKKNMERMSIEELKDRSYRNLSGGQQQRVLLARALCATSKMLLLDEPVTGLDPKVTADFYELIKRLNRGNLKKASEPITIIMISHDIREAVEQASHILHIDKERRFFGTVEEYKESDAWKAFVR